MVTQLSCGGAKLHGKRQLSSYLLFVVRGGDCLSCCSLVYFFSRLSAGKHSKGTKPNQRN